MVDNIANHKNKNDYSAKLQNSTHTIDYVQLDNSNLGL